MRIGRGLIESNIFGCDLSRAAVLIAGIVCARLMSGLIIVHVVVYGLGSPEPILNAFKSYATRALRNAGLISIQVKPWARRGSTVYLWKDRDMEKAVEYVVSGQDQEFSRLD